MSFWQSQLLSVAICLVCSLSGLYIKENNIQGEEPEILYIDFTLKSSRKSQSLDIKSSFKSWDHVGHRSNPKLSFSPFHPAPNNCFQTNAQIRPTNPQSRTIERASIHISKQQSTQQCERSTQYLVFRRSEMTAHL